MSGLCRDCVGNVSGPSPTNLLCCETVPLISNMARRKTLQMCLLCNCCTQATATCTETRSWPAYPQCVGSVSGMCREGVGIVSVCRECVGNVSGCCWVINTGHLLLHIFLSLRTTGQAIPSRVQWREPLHWKLCVLRASLLVVVSLF